LENLLGAVGVHLKVAAVFHDEVRDTERRVRPDYAVAVNRATTGYIEVKAPGKNVDPESFRGHDKTQWERQRDLPNLLYTNGTSWWLWRDGELMGDPVEFAGDLTTAGADLLAPEAFERLITDFLKWKPAPITSVGALVRAIAPLTRLLRGDVLDQLEAERRAVDAGASKDEQPFLGLAQDWRNLLFPEADDATFADGYAQTVTFALLLARTEGIDVAGSSLHEIGAGLTSSHSLMGKALQLLTEDVTKDFRVVLDVLVRVIGAVDWRRVRKGRRDTYLHLYEDFLAAYDNELRKQTGTYYTPIEVVEPMVRLAEEALTSRLGLAGGLRHDSVRVVDPAMGTGTFLLAVLERIASQVAAVDGPGAVPAALTQASRAVTGFELQMGPFAVAELRTADLLASHGVPAEERREHLYVTNTLDDPHVTDAQLASNLIPIARSRRKANEVKARANVTVVIGNPPYKELVAGSGGWVESGSHADGKKARGILEDFFDPAAGRFKAKLKNLSVYFWRWATWKVWESTTADPDGDAGVVCFITTGAYRTGPAFTGMRRYLRTWATEGWVVDLTPEGQTPDVPTRIFPGVRQPLAIGLFVRTPGKVATAPAVIHTRTVTGRQKEKFRALAEMTLDDDGWADARTDWTAPFTAAAAGGWDTYPALSDLMPWYSPGVFPTRGWVIAPSADILKQRWNSLRSEPDEQKRSVLFKEGRDANLRRARKPLPGADVHQSTSQPLSTDRTTLAEPIRYGYRTLDRQWIIPDHRVMDMPRRDLWAARQDGQIYVIEQHRHTIESGPGLVYSALVPDFDHFNNRGGRTMPFRHPDGTANLARGLTATLADRLGIEVTGQDVLAYVAAAVSHPGYTAVFVEEITTPGIRVPITADPDVWARAVELGRQVLWLHTYGTACTGAGRPAGNVRLDATDPRRIRNTTPITIMPQDMSYDTARQTLIVGDGEFAPVPPQVWGYTVGGKNVLKSWFNYRKATPGGRRSSPLDDIHVRVWPSEWNADLLDLLSVLARLVDLEPEQAKLLSDVLAGDVLTSTRLADPLDGVEGGGDVLAMAATVRPVVKWPTTKADRAARHPFTLAQD
jgi:hypothetical protein